MSITLCLAMLLVLGPQDEAEKESKVPPAIKGLTLEIEFESTTVAPGTAVLPKKITMKYTGKEPISLVQPGDGSGCDWRQPYLVWSVLGDPKAEHPPVPQQSDLPRCGLMNALRIDEVFTLKKGDKKVFEAWMEPLGFEKPGRYRVQLVYINDPERKVLKAAYPMNEPSAEVRKAFRDTTPARVASNEVTFTVR